MAVKTPNLIHRIPAMKKQLMRNGGRTIRFRRYDKLPTAPIPLGNSGAPISPTTLSAVDIDATMSFYGQFVAYVIGHVKSSLIDLKAVVAIS